MASNHGPETEPDESKRKTKSVGITSSLGVSGQMSWSRIGAFGSLVSGTSVDDVVEVVDDVVVVVLGDVLGLGVGASVTGDILGLAVVVGTVDANVDVRSTRSIGLIVAESGALSSSSDGCCGGAASGR